MIYYRPSIDHDNLLMGWYTRMILDGDLDKTFMPQAHCLSKWLGIMQAPNELVFEVDEHGIWWAAWFAPSAGCAYTGLWIRKDRRQSGKQMVQLTLDVLDTALTTWPVILTLTKQFALLEPQFRLGYTYVGVVPELWAGQSVWLCSMTRSSFTKGPHHGWWRRQRQIESGDRPTALDGSGVEQGSFPAS